MSLLITSSQSKENTNSIGIERPEQYTNHLRGALQIKPNSQIAIDSVKINRNPLFDFQDSTTSMFWFGERVADIGEGLERSTNPILDTTSWPIVQENTINDSVGLPDFITGYRKMLRQAYCYHPEINTSLTQNASFMRKKTIGTGILDGFEFQFQQVTDAPTSAKPADGEVINVFNRVPAPAYNPATGQITANQDDTLVLCACEGATNGPISLNNGSVTFNVSLTRGDVTLASSRQYVVGLTRAYDHDAGPLGPDMWGEDSHIQMEDGKGLGQDSDVFFDYAIESKDGVLRLYHFVREYDIDDAEFGEGEMTEIYYYNKTNDFDSVNNASNSSFTNSNAPCNSSEVTSITFNCQNEKLKIVVSGENYNASVLIDVVKTDSASFSRQVPKPINQACWKMYPQVYFYEDEDKIDVTEYHQRTGTTMNTNLFFGEGDWQARTSGNYYTGPNYEKDKDKQVVWEGSRSWPILLEKREWGLISRIQYPVPKNPYKGVNGSDLMDDFENILIVGRDERYLSEMPQDIWQPNTARQLGMAPFTIFPLDPSISDIGSSFSSDNPPVTSSLSSAFIRLPRFSHTTFNAGKGSLSKIVGMIPRFDNAGNDSGALFFKEPDRLYVDLNNTDAINVTDISVDIVRRDETFVNDLTGSTEVVFHIREKPRL
jgi:hypothetical protein